MNVYILCSLSLISIRIAECSYIFHVRNLSLDSEKEINGAKYDTNIAYFPHNQKMHIIKDLVAKFRSNKQEKTTEQIFSFLAQDKCSKFNKKLQKKYSLLLIDINK